MSSVVEVCKAGKSFPGFLGLMNQTALQEVSFSLQGGEALALLGPNGAGKSTLLNLLAGLLVPSRGTVRIFGRSPTETQARRKLGFLSEETSLFDMLNAVETLVLAGALFNLPKAEVQRRTSELLHWAELENAAERPLKTYSKGMLRRVGIAQALISNPELIILDEPTSGLDPAGIVSVKKLLETLKRNGKTLILSGHYVSELEDFCDVALILEKGRTAALFQSGEWQKNSGGLTALFRQTLQSRNQAVFPSFLERTP